MKFNIHTELLQPDNVPIQAFELITRKGYAYGFVHENVLRIHHIGSFDKDLHPVKGLMNILTKTFKTNKFAFLMVINPDLKNIIRGEVVKIPPNENIFGEWVEEIHGEWN